MKLRTPTPVSAFSVKVRTPRVVDLGAPPFAEPKGRWKHPTDYGKTKALAAKAREGHNRRDPRPLRTSYGWHQLSGA